MPCKFPVCSEFVRNSPRSSKLDNFFSILSQYGIILYWKYFSFLYDQSINPHPLNVQEPRASAFHKSQKCAKKILEKIFSATAWVLVKGDVKNVEQDCVRAMNNFQPEFYPNYRESSITKCNPKYHHIILLERKWLSSTPDEVYIETFGKN